MNHRYDEAERSDLMDLGSDVADAKLAPLRMQYSIYLDAATSKPLGDEDR